MATNEEGSRNMLVVAQEQKNFLRDEIKLKKLQRVLNKESVDALDVLVKIMAETKDEKLRAQCAKDILAFTISVNKEINNDQIQRMVAQIRLGSGPQGNLIPLENGEKPSRPVVNFNELQSID